MKSMAARRAAQARQATANAAKRVKEREAARRKAQDRQERAVQRRFSSSVAQAEQRYLPSDRLKRVRISSTPYQPDRYSYWEDLSDSELEELGRLYESGRFVRWQEDVINYTGDFKEYL